MKNKSQSGGDYSNNYQAETINKFGLSYTDVKAIANELIEKNFQKLSKIAHEQAISRIQEIVKDVIEEIKKQDGLNTDKFADPDIQSSLFSIQVSYAKSGSPNLKNWLINSFVRLLKTEKESLEEIVLKECLNIFSKITEVQLNILSLKYQIDYIQRNNLKTYEDLKEFIKDELIPLLEKIRNKSTSITHLIYLGCINENGGIRSGLGFIGDIYEIYNGGLTEFFDSNSLKISETSKLLLDKFCTKYEDDIYKFNVLNRKDLRNKLIYLPIEQDLIEEVLDLYSEYTMSQPRFRQMIDKDIPELKELEDRYRIIDTGNYHLTTIGLALAEIYLNSQGYTHISLMGKFLEE